MADKNDKRRRVTRRGFIKQGTRLGASAAMAPLVLKLSACSSDKEDKEPSATGDSGIQAEVDASREPADAGNDAASATGAIEGDTVLLGLYPGDGSAALTAAAPLLDFSWLGEGDSVLIKVASNSGNPHPATTAVSGVTAMAKELKARGAGRVIVGDQAGVEWVRNSKAGRFSSTRERFETNGLIGAESEAELHFFDEGDWDSGYFEASLPSDHRWPRGMYVASIIKEVDHIIYMPRISAHMLAGLTHGHKCAIGWLRDDSRHDLHNDAGDYYEKYAEINYVEEIASRFRMVVTVTEQVLLHGGPDVGTPYAMDPPLVLASKNLANHDALAASILVSLQNSSGTTPSGMVYNAANAALFNGFFAGGTNVADTAGVAGPWLSESPSSQYTAHEFESSVDGERAVARGWELNDGKPDNIDVVLDGDPLDATLRDGIETHGEGLYKLA